jgi:oligopeptide transport system substrate-binding protein
MSVPPPPPCHAVLFRAAAAALALLALAAAGCKPRQTLVDAARGDQTLHLGNGAEPGDLDPHLATAYIEFNILLALGEGLTALDEATGRPAPAAASSWDVSADGLRYTFRLRPEAKWSDGGPLLASHFLFSFERILRPALGSEYAYMLFPVRGAEDFNAGRTTDFSSVGFSAPDERTLVVDLSSPTPYFLGLVAHQAWFPVHPPTILKHGKIDQRGTAWTRPENFVGNGAYRLAVWSRHDRIEVVRHPHYWSGDTAGPRRVVFYPTDNVAADESAYRAGQRHATYDLAPDRIATYRAQSPSPLRIDPLLETRYLRFNTTRAPFDDSRVRRALALAIDREALAASVLQGSRLPAFHYVPPGAGGFTSQSRQPHDPAAARALLAEAGFPEGRGLRRIEIVFNPAAVSQPTLEAVQAMWKRELGVDSVLLSQDFKVYLESLKNLAYDVGGSRWIGDYDDPNTYLDMFLAGGGNNQTGWSRPDYDRLVAEAARAPDEATRFAAFQRAENLLLADAPIAPLVFGARVQLVHPDIRAWHPSLLGIRRYQTLRLAP